MGKIRYDGNRRRMRNVRVMLSDTEWVAIHKMQGDISGTLSDVFRDALELLANKYGRGHRFGGPGYDD
jgi:hypothetical protein